MAILLRHQRAALLPADADIARKDRAKERRPKGARQPGFDAFQAAHPGAALREAQDQVFHLQVGEGQRKRGGRLACRRIDHPRPITAWRRRQQQVEIDEVGDVCQALLLRVVIGSAAVSAPIVSPSVFRRTMPGIVQDIVRRHAILTSMQAMRLPNITDRSLAGRYAGQMVAHLRRQKVLWLPNA